MDIRTALRVLGMRWPISRDTVLGAYKKLRHEFHPDKNHEPGSTERAQQINAAKDCLLCNLPPAYKSPAYQPPLDLVQNIKREDGKARGCYGGGDEGIRRLVGVYV